MARITKLELQQINARLAAENEALRAELSKLRNDAAIQRAERRQAPDASERRQAPNVSEPRQAPNVSQPRQAPNVSERCAKLEALKAFATKFHCTARLRDGVIELYSKKRGCWVTVPEGAQP